MTKRNEKKKNYLLCLLAASVSLGIHQQVMASTSTETVLEQGFETPPHSARPLVWWHWMNGNITKDGIDKDLEWMHKVGIGGVHNFDASMSTPQIVAKRLSFMSPDWQDAFRHAVQKADSFGMDFGIASSAGWSETGGPWVKPKDGMKKVVWSTLVVKGGSAVTQKLPDSPATTGPFQEIPGSALFEKNGEKTSAPMATGTIGVFAVPVTHAAITTKHSVLVNGQAVDAHALQDNDLQTSISVPLDNENHATFVVNYDKPVKIRSARLMIKDGRMPFAPERFKAELQARVGDEWQSLGIFPLYETTTTLGFDAVNAQQYRVVMTPLPALSSAGLLGATQGAQVIELFPPAATKNVDVLDFQLSSEAQITQFEAKAGFATVHNYYDIANNFSEQGVDVNQIIDLTDKVSPNGEINWVPPKGQDWEIIHLGWSLTGKTNHPATPEATGLEVDKYDPTAVHDYISTYLDKYQDVVGEKWMGKHGINSLVTDSLEIGASNWTPKLLEEFKSRRGYDAKPWLPALTGVLIGTPAQSDQFLFDYRATLAELFVESHYKTIAQVAHERGLKVFGESLEDQRPTLGDDIEMRRWTDVPMAALWSYDRHTGPRPGLLGDIRSAASAAHFYGQNLVAAESMTSAFSPWSFAPADLKRVIDLEFAYGVNRPAIHTSVHQPVDDKQPGLSLFIFGQHFNRHETWADMARPWVDYISRNSYLLQQGRYNADVAMFYGEDTPVTTTYADAVPTDLPKHFAYDFVNREMLKEMKVEKSGDLVEYVSPGGARYRVIALYGTSEHMTYSTLTRLKALADQGGLIVGKKPVSTPSLSDDQEKFAQLVDQIWSKPNVLDEETSHLDTTLVHLGMTQDVTTASDALENDKLMFVHRKLEDGDLYYVNNRTTDALKEQVTFRVSGYTPEIWNPVDGSTRQVSYTVKNGVTVIDLDLQAEESLYVVFVNPSKVTHHIVMKPKVINREVVSGPWSVKFEKGLELPKPMKLDHLAPLEQSSDPKVKYFSGTTSYKATMHITKLPNKNEALWLDLGKVGDVAQVFVNGQEVSTLWYSPKQVDISAYVKQDENALEVKVANLWVNRLIGDKQPGANPVTWTAAPTFKPDAELRPSGLIGPVTLVTKENLQ